MRIDLAKVPTLGKVGRSVKIIDPKLPQSLIIGRSGDTEYVVVSIKCPHRGVEVEYTPAAKQFRCASLGHSTFALDGTYKNGLAKKSLTKFDAKLDPADKGSLIISLG